MMGINERRNETNAFAGYKMVGHKRNEDIAEELEITHQYSNKTCQQN
jgi:hypothetical protein